VFNILDQGILTSLAWALIRRIPHEVPSDVRSPCHKHSEFLPGLEQALHHSGRFERRPRSGRCIYGNDDGSNWSNVAPHRSRESTGKCRGCGCFRNRNGGIPNHCFRPCASLGSLDTEMCSLPLHHCRFQLHETCLVYCWRVTYDVLPVCEVLS